MSPSIPIGRLALPALLCALAAPASLRAQDLGPADGHDFVGVDTSRVAVGDPAPDFTLESLEGPRVTLSDFRGRKDVILVFYRGHW